VIDAVVTVERMCVYFEPGDLPGGLEEAVEKARAEGAPSWSRDLVIEVHYDGPDLFEVATRCGLAPKEVIDLHTSKSYEVRMLGFLPGFAYLGGVDSRLAVPRRPLPRPRVEPGSVGIAAGYTAVYPFASPGGWNLIGRATPSAVFQQDGGARLRLGDRVRFKSAG
jgi:5-oxoprolinase (ATP-hydrolysing) subunit A